MDENNEEKEAGQGMDAAAAPIRVIVQTTEAPKNEFGVAGFVLSLVCLVFSWIPVFSWILWVLGLVFSVLGVHRKPKGLAIAGLVCTLSIGQSNK